MSAKKSRSLLSHMPAFQVCFIATEPDKIQQLLWKLLPMEFHHALVLVSLTVLCLIADCCSGECMFQYVRQPPSTTIQDCDPYDQENRIMIRLQCALKVHNNFTFEIRWFQKNTVGEVVNLGRGQSDNLIALPMTMFSEAVSIYHNNKLLGNQYNPSFLGKYWCQVINTTADSYQPLMRSNMFTLLPPENYTGQSCIRTTTQVEQNVSCANATDSTQSTSQPATQSTSQPATQSASQPVPTSTTITNLAGTMPSSIVYIAAGVSGGVLLLFILVVCSILIALLIVMKRRRKTRIEDPPNKTTGGFNNPTNDINVDNQYYEAHATDRTNNSSQPVIYMYAEPNQTRETEIKETIEISNGVYHLLGDTTTCVTNPTCIAAGVNNQYFHLEDVVTRRVDTEYSKLGHDESISTHQHTTNSHYSYLNHQGLPHKNDCLPYDEQDYSSLNHDQPPPLSTMTTSNADYYNLSHKDTTLQQYSSLDHHSMQPTTQVDADKVAHSTEQQYSTLQNHTMSPTTDSDKMSHPVTSDQHLYSVLNDTASQ